MHQLEQACSLNAARKHVDGTAADARVQRAVAQ